RRRPVGARLGPPRQDLPPEMRWLGHSPSQLQKCLAVGHRLMSVPISLSTPSAVDSSIPSVAVRPTPAIRYNAPRASKPGRLSPPPRRALGGRRRAAALVGDLPHLPLDLAAAGGDPLAVEVVQPQGLFEGEQVLRPPGAVQRPGDLRLAVPAAVVAQLRQRPR